MIWEILALFITRCLVDHWQINLNGYYGITKLQTLLSLWYVTRKINLKLIVDI